MNVYVDGSGGDNSRYGFYIKETGESKCEYLPNMTNNEAEYRGIITALEQIGPTDKHIMIYSDSKIAVNQINHEYHIKKKHLRDLASKVWELLPGLPNCEIVWIPRDENIAGKMLG